MDNPLCNYGQQTRISKSNIVEKSCLYGSFFFTLFSPEILYIPDNSINFCYFHILPMLSTKPSIFLSIIHHKRNQQISSVPPILLEFTAKLSIFQKEYHIVTICKIFMKHPLFRMNECYQLVLSFPAIHLLYFQFFHIYMYI